MSLSENINSSEELEYNILEYVRNTVNNMMGGGKSKDSRKILKRKIKKELNDYLMANKKKIKHKNINLNKERLEHQIAEIFDNRFNNSYQDMSFIDYFNYYPLVPIHATTSSKPIISTPAPAAPIPTPVAAPRPTPVAAPRRPPVVAPKPTPVVAPKPTPVVAPVAAPVVAPVVAPVAAPVAARNVDFEKQELVKISQPAGAKYEQIKYKVLKEPLTKVFLQLQGTIANAFDAIDNANSTAADIARNQQRVVEMSLMFGQAYDEAKREQERIENLYVNLQATYKKKYTDKYNTIKTQSDQIEQEIKEDINEFSNDAISKIPQETAKINTIRTDNLTRIEPIIKTYKTAISANNTKFLSEVKKRLTDGIKQLKNDNVPIMTTADNLIRDVDNLYKAWVKQIDELFNDIYGPTGSITQDIYKDFKYELTQLGYTFTQMGSGYNNQTSDEQTLNNYLSETSAF
jgi:hypothetical protein